MLAILIALLFVANGSEATQKDVGRPRARSVQKKKESNNSAVPAPAGMEKKLRELRTDSRAINVEKLGEMKRESLPPELQDALNDGFSEGAKSKGEREKLMKHIEQSFP